MIGRSPRLNRNLATVAFALLFAGTPLAPKTAIAAAVPVDGHAAAHVVVFSSQGTSTQHITKALTVGDFLKERGIAMGPYDFVRPEAQTPVADNMTIEYAQAVAVKLISGSQTKTVMTAAGDVGALLEEQGITLGQYDVVRPSLADPIVGGSTIKIAHVVKWVATVQHRIAQRTIHEINFALPPGRSKVIAQGRPGIRETMVDYTQTDGTIRRQVIGSRLLRSPKTRVIAEGVGTYAAFADFGRRGLQKTSYIAASALSMIATAYTAECDGCSGYTASGSRAGRGIVAVDPSIIPLGTRLYIPGYGFAIAGDTGGAIRGNRIDLGFNSLGDALGFGRRTVKVYTLH